APVAAVIELRGGGRLAWIEEHRDGDRHLATPREVVDDVHRANVAVGVHHRLTVLPNDERRGLGRVVLRRYVDRVAVRVLHRRRAFRGEPGQAHFYSYDHH